MGENSKIEWTDHTFNPWVGCTKVSPACDHCYAEGWAKRTGNANLWAGKRRRTSVSNWMQPAKWNREAKAAGVRRKVFCASLADVFDNQVPDEWRLDLANLIEDTPHLDWLLLTKRPQSIAKLIPRRWDEGLPVNIWLGTTVENQTEANRRIPYLLQTPAAKRFLSCEPLLGPVDLRPWLSDDDGCDHCDDGQGYGPRCGRDDIPRDEQCPTKRAVFRVTEHGPVDQYGCPASITHDRVTVDWVIAGGESGQGARPMHPDWARSLRDQCAEAGVPFFFKQHGNWRPVDLSKESGVHDWMILSRAGDLDIPDGRHPDDSAGEAAVIQVGKKAAGALLDGREHREFPS